MRKRCLPLGLLTFAVLSVRLRGKAAAAPPCFQCSLVGLEVGPTGSQLGGATNDPGFAIRFDGRQIACATKACDAEYLVIWTREGDRAFYDSKLQPKPPGFGQRDVLREAVEEGGKLIATGLSGTRRWRGETNSQSELSELIGARLIRELDSTDNWVRFGRRDFSTETGRTQRTSPSVSSKTLRSEHQSELTPLVENLRTDWPFLVRGPAVVYEPTTATPAGDLLKPQRTSLQAENRYNKDWPMSADAPVGPAILFNRLGKGAVLTFAASPDWATASDHHLTETRKLLANAVRLLHSEPRITIAAPANVQAIVTDDPATRTLRVHLLGYNTPPQTTPAKDRPYVLPVPIEDAPLYRATLTLRDRPKRAKAFNKSTAVRRSGHKVELQVEGIHEVVTVQY